ASFFKIHRWVEQRDGWTQWKLAPLRKNIYSLRDLRKLMNAANERYLAYMADIDNPGTGLKDIDKMSDRAKDQGRSFRGFNLFLKQDYRLFLILSRGEWSISGFRAADLRAYLPDLSSSQSSYLLKRLRTHGLIKKIGHRYKYYLTKFGRRVLAATLKLREYVVLPTLCANAI
ncbi:MAG: MarR family transcriptional regulator, partial [Gammaproteobacteria bacterium]|nr:MarR family transcriptional regulator [Gammaproteobacteria bacterium]